MGFEVRMEIFPKIEEKYAEFIVEW